MSDLKRLYIFTGKGGVGKTTCAFSFANYLKNQGKDVYYAHIAGSSIDKNLRNDSEFDFPDLKIMDLEIKEATAEYVSMKLKSKIVGSLVVKTPFFKSLVSMIPGFNYLIYLGKIIHTLKNNPQTYIVFDSPSSGHALTMLRATENFGEIFKTGVVYEDTKMMKDFLFQKDLIKVNIISIPTEMSANEAKELSAEIQSISSNITSEVTFNDVIDKELVEDDPNAPQFLKEKIRNQQEVLKDHLGTQIPHSTLKVNEEIAIDIIPFIEKLI